MLLKITLDLGDPDKLYVVDMPSEHWTPTPDPVRDPDGPRRIGQLEAQYTTRLAGIVRGHLLKGTGIRWLGKSLTVSTIPRPAPEPPPPAEPEPELLLPPEHMPME